MLALLLHQLHGIVDHLAQAVHHLAVPVGQPGGSDVLRQVHQIGVLGLLGEKQGAAGEEITGLHRQYTPVSHRAVFQDLSLHQLEAAVGITKKNQPQNGHTVLVGGQLGAGTEQVGGLPKLGFQLTDVDHKGSSFRWARILFITL